MSYNENLANEVIRFLVGYMLFIFAMLISISLTSMYMNPEPVPLDYDYASITQQLLC
jgi:hypothetical protein